MNCKPIHLAIVTTALHLGVAMASPNELATSPPQMAQSAPNASMTRDQPNATAESKPTSSQPPGNDCFPGAYIIHFDDLNNPRITGGGGHCPDALPRTGDYKL